MSGAVEPQVPFFGPCLTKSPGTLALLFDDPGLALLTWCPGLTSRLPYHHRLVWKHHFWLTLVAISRPLLTLFSHCGTVSLWVMFLFCQPCHHPVGFISFAGKHVSLKVIGLVFYTESQVQLIFTDDEHINISWNPHPVFLERQKI